MDGKERTKETCCYETGSRQDTDLDCLWQAAAQGIKQKTAPLVDEVESIIPQREGAVKST
jgi:hypothetical protein